MRLHRPLLAVAAALVAVPILVAVAGASEPSTAFTPPLALMDADGTSLNAAEPSIEVDSHGQVYVSGPVGIPTGGCPFWEVDADAGTYDYRGTIDVDHFSVGGGDCDISLSDNPAADATHDVASVTSLSLANLTSNTTSDGGATWMPVANPASQQIFGVDRQWQVADRELDRHYLTVHDLATVNIQVSVAIDGGYQYVQNTPAIDPTTTSQALSTGVSVRGITGSNSFGTTVVDPQTHKLYIPFIAPSGSTFEQNGIYVAEGDPCATVACEKGMPAGPISWTNHLAYAGPLTEELGSGFPAIALAADGVLHLAWTGDTNRPASAGPGQDANHVFTMHSQPGNVAAGAWSAPQYVDSGTGYANTFPWMVAGNGGHVGIAWYSSTEAAACVGPAGPSVTDSAVPDEVNDSCRNEWSVTYASSQNANDTSPTWDRVVASNGVVHRGAICTGGLSCPAGTRTLLDFFDIAVDALGRPNLAFNSDVRQPGVADVHFTRQCSGTSLTGVELGGTCGDGTDPTPTPTTGTACPGKGAGFVDKADDATEVFGEPVAANESALDILSGSVSWDAATSSALFRTRVADLNATPTVGDAAFLWTFTAGGDATPYTISTHVPADGSTPTTNFSTGPTDGNPLETTIDRAGGTITVRLPSTAYVAQQAGNTALTADRPLSITSVSGRRLLDGVVVTNAVTVDSADTLCSGTFAQPVVVTPSPTPTATTSPTATPTPTSTPTSTPTPTPTCTPSGGSGGGGGGGQGGGGQGGGGTANDKCPKK